MNADRPGLRARSQLYLRSTGLPESRYKRKRLKEVPKFVMKRMLIKAILVMGGKVLFVTLLAGAIIGVIGYQKGWDTSMAYSNAFFIAGCMLIIAGTSSRFVASQEWNVFQQLHADSFRDMSSHEQLNFIIEASSSVSLLVLGVTSGVLLILTAVLVTKWF